MSTCVRRAERSTGAPESDGGQVEAAPRTTNSSRGWGALDLAASVLVVLALAVMIGDQARFDAFVPGEYFSYFTIQTSLIDVVVLAWGGVALLGAGSVSSGYTTARAAVVAYGVVTGVIYNALLRGIDPEPGAFVSEITWPNEIVHVVIPLYLVLEWVLHRDRPAIGRSAKGLAAVGRGLLYPLAWVVFALVRGAADGWYPYDFLDPATAGWAWTAAYVVGIAVFIGLLVAGAVAINRRRVTPAPNDPRAGHTGGMNHADLMAGPPETHLPVDPAEAELASATPADVVRRHPDSPAAWAALAVEAREGGADDVTVYAYSRVGYHRSLDMLRRSGWKGHGPVPWDHEPNRGFLICLAILARTAQLIGETEEWDRCSEFLRDSSPAAYDALLG